MANFNDIKHEIDQNVNTNGVQAITGAILNETLKDMIDEVDEKKQDTLVAGQNITIQGNVISATGGGSGTTYTEGHGIDISVDNEISVDTQELAGYGLNNTDYQFNVDTSVIQGKLTAGANIQINGDTISATDTNTTYSAGSGLNLNGTTFSVDSSSLAGSGLEVDEFGALKTDPSLIQSKLTAGDGIEIDQSNEISVKAGSGLGFDANGYLINTGGGGGGTTYTAGDGIEIDSSDAINAKLGNGLQLDQNNNIEIDPSVVATQNDLAGKQDTLTAGNGIDIDSNNVISVDPSDLAGNGLQVNQSGYIVPDFNVVASQSDLLGKQDTLVAGTNITISGNVISATGGGQSYSAGSGIDITNNVISVDNTIATQSDLLGKQDTLVAGANIQINGNTISATDTNTTYSAGNGLNLNGTTFSVDTSTIQEKLTAGTGISINGTTISATGGGGGGSYSAGDGINIDSNNVISVDASDLAGAGLLSDLNNNLSVDANDLAGNGLQVDANGRLEVVGGSGGSLWTTGAGTESRISSPNIAGTAAGDYAIAGGFNPTATGDYSFAFGNRPTVSGDNGVAIGYQPTAGIGSVALGYVANASGQNSFAAGHNVSATGTDSTAIGPSASASAGYATAIGNSASAAGTGSVAIGSGTQTTTSFEQAFGKYNLSNNSASDDAATAYTIGNGTSVGARSNSIEIKKNDDIYVIGVGGFDGTNASSSQTLQDVINNGGGGGNYLLLEGGTLQADSSITDTTSLQVVSPSSITYIILDSYDNLDPNDPQGTATITMTDSNGYIQIKPNGVSDGTYTASWPTLSADDTIALLSDIPAGLWEEGSGRGSIKNMEAASANGDHAFVAGYNAHADGNYSVALGARANASYANAFAIGADAVASQSHAFAIGKDANSSASYAYAIGRDASSSASYAAAIGRGVQATNQNEVGLGVYNKSTTGSTSDDNSKFTIGNGTGNAARSNVLEIKENGDAYLYGVGGFTGANTSAATTLQDVINNGGGGSSYTAGSGIDITNNTISVDTTTIQEKLTAGSNITISGNVISATGGGASYSAGSGIDITNNTISVDNTIATVSDLGEYLPLTGGTLQNSASEPETRLELVSPKRGDCAIVAYANGEDSDTYLNLESSSVSEREPGMYASSSGLSISTGGQTGFYSDVSAGYVESNGTFTLDEFYSSANVVAPDGAAEIILETNSSGLSDPGNETREARLAISDDRGSIELNPTGFSDGTYTLSFPTLSQNETIATLSDIQGGGSSYSAGTGINIDANNVISNTAPGLWIAGTGTNAVVPPGVNASSASGTQSIVLGTGMASANYSIAGATGIAHSPYSIALGYNSESGYNAITGLRSIALGNGAIALSNDEIGVGIYNKSYNNSSTSIANIFSVGTGGDVLSRHNALEIKKNDDIYVSGVGGFNGTNYSSASTLQAVLSGKQDTLTAGSGISIVNNVISATGGGGGGSLWTSGTGTDSLVAPATVSSGLSLDPASGNGAISCGYDTTADGDFSFASGGATVASGDYSFAANNGTATGNYSAAFGAAGANGTNSFAAVSGSADADYSVALAGGQVVYDDTDPNDIKNAQYGVAIGDGSVVEGEYGLAFMGGLASGSHNIAFGDGASSGGLYSTAFPGSSVSGNYSFAASTGQASGHYSSAFGGGNAQGEGSLASGFSTSAYGYCSAALGYSLSTYDQADGTTDSDPNAGEVALGRHNYSEQGIVFTVGCGYIDTTDPDNPTEVRQNAVAIDSDGKIYLKGLGGYTGQSVSGCTDLVSFLNNL